MLYCTDIWNLFPVLWVLDKWYTLLGSAFKCKTIHWKTVHLFNRCMECGWVIFVFYIKDAVLVIILYKRDFPLVVVILWRSIRRVKFCILTYLRACNQLRPWMLQATIWVLGSNSPTCFCHLENTHELALHCPIYSYMYDFCWFCRVSAAYLHLILYNVQIVCRLYSSLCMGWADIPQVMLSL